MKEPELATHSYKKQKDILKVTIGQAAINKAPPIKHESMAASKNHTQKLKTRARLIKNAEPLYGGQREERGRKGTCRDSKSPHVLADEIMFQVIPLARAAKDTS